MKRTIAIILAALMMFALFAACGKSDSGDTNTSTPGTSGTVMDKNSDTIALPSTGTTTTPSTDNTATTEVKYNPSADARLRIACQRAPESLCTLSASNVSTVMIQSHSFFIDTMIGYDAETNSLVPSLAESWEWIDDVTLRLHIRNDIDSIRGDHFTAEDVAYTFETGCSQALLNSTYASLIDIEKCKVVDEYTYDLVLLVPNQFFLFDLTRTTYPYICKASVEAIGGLEKCREDPSCGTGPYKLVEWDQVNGVVKVERNENYWGKLPYYKYIDYYTVVDTTARGMGVEAGDYDVCLNPSTSTAMGAMTAKTVKTLVQPCSTNLIWCFNTTKEPWGNKALRQAIALAINYDAVIQIAYSGYADKCDSLWSVNCPWHVGPEEGEEEFYYYTDMARAKEKMVEAGYPDGGIDCEVFFTSGMQYLLDGATVIASNLKELGINLSVATYESAVVSARQREGDYDIYFSLSTAPTPTMGLKFSDPRKDYTMTNRCGQNWGPENVGDIIDKCTGAASMEECLEALKEYQDIVREYVPEIALCSPNNFNVVANKVVGAEYDITATPKITSFYEEGYITK